MKKSNELCPDWESAAPIPTEFFTDVTAYYDAGGGGYWFRDDRDKWITVNESALRRFLRAAGYCSRALDGEPVSQVDRKLNEIQLKHNVDFAGPLAGHKVGFLEIGGFRMLVTSAPKLIEPVKGEWPTLRTLIENLLCGPDHDQTPYFLGWLKVAYEALREGFKRPGQALAITGPPESGKSLLQMVVITEALGGRAAKPYREMSGNTTFNSELFGAEHLIIEDEVASTDIRKRLQFGTRIKEITVNELHSYHAKHHDAVNLKPFWRLSISLNSEPENLLILPPIDESLADKIMLLKAHKKPMPMPTHTMAERAVFKKTLLAELPAFLWHLVQWPIPDALKSERFGIVHYHHPEILRAMGALAPEVRLLELIDNVIMTAYLPEATAAGAPVGMRLQTGAGEKPHVRRTATDLQAELCNSQTFGYEARQLLTWQGAAGAYLGRLAKSYPERVKQDRTENSRFWLLFPPA